MQGEQVDPRRPLPQYLDFLTDEERAVIVAKFWRKTSLRQQSNGSESERYRLRKLYRSALAKIRELLS